MLILFVVHLTLICYQTHFYSVDIVEFVTAYFVIHDGGMYGGVEGPPHIFVNIMLSQMD